MAREGVPSEQAETPSRPFLPVALPARRFLRWSLALAIFVGALWLLHRTMGSDGWRLVGERIGSAHRGWLALAMLSTLGAYTAWALRWRLVLRPIARVRWWPAQRALMISVLVNTIVPFARSLGGLVRATALGRSEGLSVPALYGATLVDQAGYSTASLSLGALSVPFAVWSGGAGRVPTMLSIAFAIAALCAIAVVARRRRERILIWVRTRVPGAARAVEDAVGAARTVVLRPSTWAVEAMGGSAQWGCNVLTFFFAGLAIGAPYDLGGAAAAWSFGSIAGVASGTPGGVGTTESAAIVPLIALGVSPPEALAAILLARLLQYGSAIVLGGACLLATGSRYSSRAA